MVHRTAKQVISRSRKNQNIFKMYKDEKCMCKAYKNTVFCCQICKCVGFLLLSWLLISTLFIKHIYITKTGHAWSHEKVVCITTLLAMIEALLVCCVYSCMIFTVYNYTSLGLQGPVSQRSRNFLGDKNPFISSIRTCFKL